jgi:hypothetical protein
VIAEVVVAVVHILRDDGSIPKKVREALGAKRDRFEAACGKAQVKWRTDDLMALLRGAD